MNTAQEKIEWAVQFAEMSLDNLSPGHWLTLQEEMTAFLGESRVSPQELTLEQIGWARLIAEVLLLDCVRRRRERGGGLTIHLPAGRKRPTLDTVLNGVSFDDSHGKLTIDTKQFDNFSFDLSQAGPPRLTVVAHTLVPAFTFALGVALSGIDTGRIRDCPTCAKLFFAEHGRQEFCSAKCKGRDASRRFRARHREELAEKAHGYYQRKTETKSKGKVQRRRRTNKKKEV